MFQPMSISGAGSPGVASSALDLRLVALEQHDLDRQMRLLVKVTAHPFPDRDDLRIVCDRAHPDRAAHGFHLCLLHKSALGSPAIVPKMSEQRHPEHRPADELAQDVARRRHDDAGVGVAEEAFDAGML